MPLELPHPFFSQVPGPFHNRNTMSGSFNLAVSLFDPQEQSLSVANEVSLGFLCKHAMAQQRERKAGQTCAFSSLSWERSGFSLPLAARWCP